MLKISIAIPTLLIVFLYFKEATAGSCYCFGAAGTYCGSQGAQGLLGGDCSPGDLYLCKDGKASEAKWLGRCHWAQCNQSPPRGKDDKGRTDFCSIESGGGFMAKKKLQLIMAANNRANYTKI